MTKVQVDLATTTPSVFCLFTTASIDQADFSASASTGHQSLLTLLEQADFCGVGRRTNMGLSPTKNDQYSGNAAGYSRSLLVIPRSAIVSLTQSFM